MNKRHVSAFITAIIIGLIGASVVAASSGGHRGLSHRDQVVDYWSPAKIAGAQHRNIVLDAPINTHPRNDNPGKGNKPPKDDEPGDSGGTVTGSSWEEISGSSIAESTGRVLFTLAGIDYVCSAGVVDDGNSTTIDNLGTSVVTAGHCVWDDSVGYASNFMYIPDYESGGSFSNETGPFGLWVASETDLRASDQWVANGDDYNHDYAFVTFLPQDAIGDSDLDVLDVVVPPLEISFSESVPREIHAFGYPAEKKFKGNDLIYCAGPDLADPTGLDTRGIQCNMNGGSSGGVWLKDFDPANGNAGTVNSVTSYSYLTLKGYLFGPILGQDAEDLFNQIIDY